MNDDPVFRAVAWVLVGGLAVAELYRRLVTGHVPADFSAYLAAADVWFAGGDPYGAALLEAERYGGFPYVYPPGTLPLVAVFHLVPSTVAAVGEFLMRVAVLVGLATWFRRQFSRDVPLFALLVAGLLFEPLVSDSLAGNLAVYMLGAVVLVRELASRAPGGPWFLVGVPVGVAVSFKPMWLVPIAAVALLHRHWRLLAAVAAGVAAVAGLTVDQWHLVDSWLARIETVRTYYQSADLLSLGRWLGQSDWMAWLPPAAFPAAALLAWAAVGIYLAEQRELAPIGASEGEAPERRDGPGDETARDALWLWACVSLVGWPRLAAYSYVLLIPVVGYFWQRWSRRRFFIFAIPAFGPVPLLLRSVHGGMFHRILLYLWALAAAVLLYRELTAGRD